MAAIESSYCRVAPGSGHFTYQQSFPVLPAGAFAPSACCAAVGCPCICRCASWDDVGPPAVCWFIALVGGCWPELEPVPTVAPVLPGVGPEPASRISADLPVLHGPAIAAALPST
ncbi:MAG: hypothetical protein JWQ24_2461, partial [Tardiphaga sp.]|nr:hypothetical protein [Tardiphaga sp.]